MFTLNALDLLEGFETAINAAARLNGIAIPECLRPVRRF